MARVLASALALAGILVPAAADALGPPPPPSSTTRSPGDDAPPRTTPPTVAPTTPKPSTPPPPGSTPPPPPTGGGTTTTEPEPLPTEPVDLSDTWSYAGRGGSQPRYVRSGDVIEIAPNPEGYYSGVSLEGNHVPPFPARSMGSKPALLTWTGFERTAGGSRVFFELSADVATKLDIRGSTITLRMANTKINVRNNARSLDLRYFRTPVRSIKVSRRGKDTIATVVLKREAAPSLVVMQGKAGYRMLVLEFAGATEAVEAPIDPP